MPGSLPNPVGVRVSELLEPGEWVPIATLIREATHAVPPGVAIRRAEKVRKRVSDSPFRVVGRTPATLIRSGIRSMVTEVLHSNRKRYEIAEIDGIRMARLRPKESNE